MKMLKLKPEKHGAQTTHALRGAAPAQPSRRRVIAVLVLCGLFALGSAGAAVGAEVQRVKGEGTLTAVQENGTLIISERGYNLSPRALILDYLGKKTTLDKFMLPAVVSFEYVYTPNGAEIRLIRELAQ